MRASEILVTAREAAGLSQAELARRAGMTRSVVNVYEHGHREPGADALVHLLSAAGQQIALTRITPPVDPWRAGRILEQVLGLAEALPFSPRESNGYPPLSSRLAG